MVVAFLIALYLTIFQLVSSFWFLVSVALLYTLALPAMSANGFSSRSVFDEPRRKRRRKSSNPIPGKIYGALKILLGRGSPSKNERKKLVRKIIIGFVLFVFLYFAFLWITLPDIDDPASLIASQSSVITDRNGVELYRLFSEEDRTYITGEQIPDHMKQAMIAIEDERYYERGCLDMKAIMRAVIFWGRAGGGSTITRQLARNSLNLFQDNKYNRKLKEVVLGCQLERRFDKDELIELYLNWIPFGQNAYGVEQASQIYFGVEAKDLTLAQSAVLASLPQRPSYFNPYGRHLHTEVSENVHKNVIEGNITKSSQIPNNKVMIGLLGDYAGTGSSLLYVGGRTDQVLQNMEDQEFINEQERLTAIEELENMEFEPTRENIRAPHFVLWIKEEIENMFSATSEEGLFEQGGLTIETTLDWDMQEAAEEVIEFHREDILTRFGAYNMALVSMDPKTREILAYVGNMDYFDTEHGGKIDMVHAPRQPGSSFKPFIYASAFQHGYSPATPIWDVPTKIGDNEPQNFDGLFKGLMTMRQALGASRNIPAAKTFFLAGGEEKILRLVRDLGAPTPLVRKSELAMEREDGFDYGWPLALGAAETPLIEMVQAYGTFASGGESAPVVPIRRITDKKGNILYEAQSPVKTNTVLDNRIAYQVTSILSDEWARPEEYWKTQLTIPGYQTAAKTGTSNKCLEWKDEDTCLLRKPDNAWLVGYTPNLISGVWVGNADSSAMFEKAGGLNTASPIWRDYMMRAHRKIKSPKTEFEAPEGVVRPQVSMLSGEFATECTPVHLRRADIFLKENAPSAQDPACKQLIVDKLTHLLASDECPKEAQEEGQFLVAQSLLPKRWPQWEEGVQEWVSKQMELWYADETHSGAIITLPIAPTDDCELSLTPGRLEKPELTIKFPTQGGVASYPAFHPKIDYTVVSEIREVVYKVDGKRVARQESKPFDRTIRVPRSVKKSGLHSLTVILVDEYYNEITKSVSFRFDEDKKKPTVRLIKPKSDISIKSESDVFMKAEANDPDGAIKYVQFFLDDTLLSTKPKEPYELTYTIGLPDGTYTLKVIAEDLAKNKAEDSITITIGKGESKPSAPVAPPEPSGGPSLIKPASSSSIRVGEVIDVHADIQGLGGNLRRVRVVVEGGVISGQDELLNLTEGEGIYKRVWKADRAGEFVIRLLTENDSGEEEEWGNVEVTVE